jgi:hypothetical protein
MNSQKKASGLVIVAMLMASAFRSSRALILQSPALMSTRTRQVLYRTNQMKLLSTSIDLEELNQKIQLKGEEIRQLKAEGIDKSALAPHVEELISLKSQLPQDPKPEKKPQQEKKAQPEKQKKQAKNPEPEMTTSELRANRLAKVEAMRKAGVEPFGYSYQITHTAAQLSNQYDGKLEPGEEDESADVSVAGRIMTRRVFGKLAFFTVQDESGMMQLQFDKMRLDDFFEVCVTCNNNIFFIAWIVKLTFSTFSNRSNSRTGLTVAISSVREEPFVELTKESSLYTRRNGRCLPNQSYPCLTSFMD